MSETEIGQDLRPTISRLGPESFAAKGRRSFFAYRDLGAAGATRDEYGASQFKSIGVMETTGFHYHVCDFQFAYVLRGWVDIEFEDGRVERLEAGSSITMPGGTVHNEVGMSSDFESIEITSPATMKTVPVDVVRAATE